MSEFVLLTSRLSIAPASGRVLLARASLAVSDVSRQGLRQVGRIPHPADPTRLIPSRRNPHRNRLGRVQGIHGIRDWSLAVSLMKAMSLCQFTRLTTTSSV